MERVVCLLTIIIVLVVQSMSSLENFYLKPIHSFLHADMASKIHNCMQGDYLYMLNKQTVEKWDYKQRKIIKTFKSSSRNSLTACFLIPQTQELVVAHGKYGKTSIVVWNETTALELRAIDGISNEVANMVYSPENDQIILSTTKDGTIFFIDFQSLTIKQSYSTNTNPSQNFSYSSMIFKGLNCPISLLLKQKDQSIIFDSNSRPLKYLNSFKESTHQSKNVALISTNCEQVFYLRNQSKLTNQSYYSTFIKRSKTTNFSEKQQKKIPVLEQIRSLNILDSERSIFLFIEDAKHIIYDYQKDQLHFGLISESLSKSQTQIRRVFIHKNKKEGVIQRFNKADVFKIQCKGYNYFDTDKTTCLPCQKNCLQCSQNYSLCSICKQGYYISGVHCLKCLLPCQTCVGQSRNCTSCRTNYIKQENNCVLDKESVSYAAAMVTSVAGSFQTQASMQIVSYFNQLWPYYYHKRNYSKKNNDFLKMIHTVENNKWFFGGIDKQINFTFTHLNFSTYNSYSNQNFLEKQNKSNYFWDSTFQFFVFSVPATLTTCLILKLLFLALFNYKCSVHIRKYSFFISFFIAIMDSSLIYIAFCAMNNFSVLFFFKFQDKLGQIIAILFTFVLFFYSVAVFFLIKYLYQKLGKYFIEEHRFTIASFAFFTIINIKSFTLGAIQAFLYDQYEYQIWNFAALEVIMIIAAIIIQNSSMSFKQKSSLCILVLKQLLMIVLDILLWIDYKIQNIQYIDGLTEMFDSLILDTIYILTGIVILKIIVTFLPSKIEKKQEQKINNIKKLIIANIDAKNTKMALHRQEINQHRLKTNVKKIAFEKSLHNENINNDKDKYSEINRQNNFEKSLQWKKGLKDQKQKYRQEKKSSEMQIFDYVDYDQIDHSFSNYQQFIVFHQGKHNKPIIIRINGKKSQNIYIDQLI